MSKWVLVHRKLEEQERKAKGGEEKEDMTGDTETRNATETDTEERFISHNL